MDCSSNNRRQEDSTLADLVSDYIEKYRGEMKRYLRDYKDQLTLNDAIEIAALCVSSNEKRHKHQWRRIQSALDESARRLLGVQDKIKMCRDFEDLRDFVDSTISDIRDIGPLTIYDTALRIGAKLGLYPKAVYLHGEVISGAKALGLNYRQNSIPIKDIPEPISSNLEPYEIEDFFCRYKKELKDLRL